MSNSSYQNAPHFTEEQKPASKWGKTAKIFAFAGLVGGIGYAGYQGYSDAAKASAPESEMPATDLTVTPVEQLMEVDDELQMMPYEEHSTHQINTSLSSESLFSPEEEAAILLYSPLSSLKHIAVGIAGNPDRAFINPIGQPQSYWNKCDHTMNYHEWKHQMGFLAYDKPNDDKTMRVAYGYLGKGTNPKNPFRIIFNHPNESQEYWQDPKHKMNIAYCKHRGDFYPMKEQQKGSFRVAVGLAGGKVSQGPFRIFMNHPDFQQSYWNDPAHLMSVKGWKHHMDFWAYPDNIKEESLTYQWTQAKTTSSRVVHVTSTTIDNTADKDQWYHVQFNYRTKETFQWKSAKLNVVLCDQTVKTVGIPSIGANGAIQISTASTFDFMKPEVQTQEKTHTFQKTANVPAKTKVKADCSTTVYNVDVPYEIRYASPDYGLIDEPQAGVWRGTIVAPVKCAWERVTE